MYEKSVCDSHNEDYSRKINGNGLWQVWLQEGVEMRLKPGIHIRPLMDDIILVQGENLVRFNSTGRFIIDRIREGFSEHDICLSIIDSYDISLEEASGYVSAFISNLEAQGIIEC